MLKKIDYPVEIKNDRVVNLLIFSQRCLRKDQGQESPCGVLQVLDLRHISKKCRLLQYQQ